MMLAWVLWHCTWPCHNQQVSLFRPPKTEAGISFPPRNLSSTSTSSALVVATMDIHPIHGMKRMVASHTTRKKVQKDIGEEYIDSKAALANVEKQLKAYSDAADASHLAWGALMKTQREFSNNMTASYPRQDPVRANAAQFASNLSALQAAATLADGEQAPWRALHATVTKYLQEIADLQKQFAPLEATFSEYLRYVSKSDKLANKKKRNEEKINRNLDKREKMRLDFHSKLNSTVVGMRAVLRKHPAVFQCALASFWLRNQNSLTLFADHTGQMHSECASITDALLQVDLTNPATYEALLPANAEPVPLLPPSTVPEPNGQVSPGHSLPVYSAMPPPEPVNFAPPPVAAPVFSPPPANLAADQSPKTSSRRSSLKVSPKKPAAVNFPTLAASSAPNASVMFPEIESQPVAPKPPPAKEVLPGRRPDAMDPEQSEPPRPKPSRPHVFSMFLEKRRSSTGAAPKPAAPKPPAPKPAPVAPAPPPPPPPPASRPPAANAPPPPPPIPGLVKATTGKSKTAPPPPPPPVVRPPPVSA